MWLIAEYEATALFSLKPASATASGGRTLLVPTPFAIKMALLDAACRTEGVAAAQWHWDWIAPLIVAIRPAARIVVNNTFIKILRPRRNPAGPGSQDAGYFGRTISYREYAQLDGPFKIAFQGNDVTDYDRLTFWLTCINYLGKRGSFIQLIDVPHRYADLPGDEPFVIIGGQIDSFPVDAVMTQLDDTGTGVSFEQASIYSNKRLSLGKERVLRHVVLPYRLMSSSRGYTYYELASS